MVSHGRRFAGETVERSEDIWERVALRTMADNPSFTIVDPRPIAAEAPYTFFLPHESELASLRVGDLVKLMFDWEPPFVKFESERMWITVLHVGPSMLMGTLENEPFEKDKMKLGDAVTFQRHDILSVQFSDPAPDICVPEHREYWERCMVDDCVLDGSEPVEFIYREEPDMGGAGDKYADSGWRIRGRANGDEDVDARTAQYVAIGAVLNKDDSWLPLIDAPIGSRFVRDFAAGKFVSQL